MSKPPRLISGATPLPTAGSPAGRSTPRSIPVGGNTNVSVRKIENGYVTRTESYQDEGGYSSKETFSKKPPTVQITDGD